VGDGGLSHAETTAFCKALQPDCFIGYNHGPPAGDIRLGELGHPSPLTDATGAGFNAGHLKGYTGHRLAEFTYPILPKHEGGAMWFYSLPKHDQLCLPAEQLYADYLGAVKFGNIFSLDVGPDYAGKLRAIDVQTLRKVGQYIRGELKPPRPPVSPDKPAETSNSGKGSSGFAVATASDGSPATRWGDTEVSAISDVEFFEQ
jgi:alpha-L-fucosidase